MRAMTYRRPERLELTEVRDRALQAGEARVAVDRAGVCGTDVRILKGEHAAFADGEGRIPGHEIVGRVVELAGPADEVAVGDRVFVAPNVGCSTCLQCRGGDENLCVASDGLGITLDGGFAEHLVVPRRAVEAGNLVPLGPDVASDTAVLVEPLACVLRGQDKVDVGEGDRVLVAGGGPVGLLHVALARARGAGRVLCSEPSEARRDAARRAGADVVVDPFDDDLAEVLADATHGAGADVVITAAPVHALQEQAVHQAAVAGRVLFFGGLPASRPIVELDTNAVHYKELQLVGTTASSLSDCRRASELVQGQLDLDWMISEVVPLEGLARALRDVRDATVIKTVVAPQREGSS